MAGQFEALDRMPIWQRIVVFIVVAAMIVAGWFFLFWTEAEDSHTAAQGALGKAKDEQTRLEGRKEAFLQEQRDHEKRLEEFASEMESLPMAASAVDNLMHTFQQKANIGGFTVESWTNEPEEKKDYYARLPIKVQGSGTWTQTAEFFRKVSELKQIVSVENISLTASRGGKDEAGDNPLLDVTFEAATYRFLSDEERAAAARGGNRKGSRKKK